MKKIILRLTFSFVSLGFTSVVFGQVDAKILNWYNGKGPGM